MHNITLDFSNPGLPQVIDVMQSDAQSRFIGLTLYDGGVPYSAPSGAQYTVQYRGSGANNMGWYDTIQLSSGTRKAVVVSSSSPNVVTLELAEQALRVNGKVEVSLCVVNNTGYKLNTFPIICRVTGAPYVDPVSVRSFFYVTGLTSDQWTAYVTACQDAQKRAEDAAATFETYPTLSIEGKAADAKATGKKYNEIKNILTDSKEGKSKLSFEIIKNSYATNSGDIEDYNGWDRTNYVQVDGHKKLMFKNSIKTNYNFFYDSKKSIISNFTLNVGTTEIEVPDNAIYFIVSNVRTSMETLEIYGIYYDVEIHTLKERLSKIDEAFFSAKMYLDEKNKLVGKYWSSAIQESPSESNSTNCFQEFAVKAGTYYYFSLYAYFCHIVHADGSTERFSSDTSQSIDGILELRDNCKIRITTNNYDTTYSFSNSIIGNYFGEKTTLKSEFYAGIHLKVVSKGGYSLKTALNCASKIASKSIPVVIDIYDGNYDIYTMMGGDNWFSSISDLDGERQGLTVSDYVSIIGHGDVTFRFEPSDNVANLANTTNVSVLEVFGNSTIENIKIIAKNCRYCIHDETNNSQNYANSVHRYIDCVIIHSGNPSGMWASPCAIASGTSSGCKYLYKNCYFKSETMLAWSMHNNSSQSGCRITFDGCEFEGSWGNLWAIKLSYYKKNTSNGYCYIKNCRSNNKMWVTPETSDIDSDNIWLVKNFTNIDVRVS